jgi:hypothetical protein
MPTATAIVFPRGYGKATQLLAWDDVRARLTDAQTYWLATTRPDGRPHVVPVDGIWFDDVWWYGGAPDTVHMRAVAAEPRAVMHLPDPLRAVIVQGVVRRTNPAPERAELMAEMSNEKYAHYGYQNDASAYAEAYGLHPSRVLAWSQFPTDATRFEFAERG